MLKSHKRSGDLQEFLERDVIPCYPEADFLFINVDGSKYCRLE